MPIIQDFQCDLRQEMNWVKGRNTIVGYVNALTIGGVPLSASLTNLWDPIASENTLQAVGVMEFIGWEGGATQPVRLSFAVDLSNQITILDILSEGWPDTAISIQFTVYNFDQAASPPCFYQTFWSNGESMNGVIAKEGAVLALEIESQKIADIMSPSLYSCRLAFVPTPGVAQTLFMANSSAAKYVGIFGTA
jgi:hypothetical protein